MTENWRPLSCNLVTIFVSSNAAPGVYTPPLERIIINELYKILMVDNIDVNTYVLGSESVSSNIHIAACTRQIGVLT